MPYSLLELDHKKSVPVHDLAADGSVHREVFHLSPRRALRKIEGSFDEVLRKAKVDQSRGDYVWINLTDRGTAFEQSTRLRDEYPNALSITRDLGMGEMCTADNELSARRSTPREVVDIFFREMTGENLKSSEAREIDTVMQTAQRDTAEGVQP